MAIDIRQMTDKQIAESVSNMLNAQQQHQHNNANNNDVFLSYGNIIITGRNTNTQRYNIERIDNNNIRVHNHQNGHYTRITSLNEAVNVIRNSLQ